MKSRNASHQRGILGIARCPTEGFVGLRHRSLNCALSSESSYPVQPVELCPRPRQVRDKYLAGAAAVRSGNFGLTLEAFIDVLERNKQYENCGAKEACKAIF
jgi:hypothetical protein